MPEAIQKPIILFDGHCALCNNFVKLLLKLDKKDLFLFAPLQSGIGRQYLGLNQVSETIDGIVLLDGNQSYTHDAAAFRIAKLLGFPTNLILVFSFLPKRFTRLVYNWVAANRYQWFGKYDSCQMPQAKHKHKFL